MGSIWEHILQLLIENLKPYHNLTIIQLQILNVNIIKMFYSWKYWKLTLSNCYHVSSDVVGHPSVRPQVWKSKIRLSAESPKRQIEVMLEET